MRLTAVPRDALAPRARARVNHSVWVQEGGFVQLTDRQARQLRAASSFRASPPTLLWYLRSSWHIYLFLTVVGGFGFGFSAWIGRPVASGFFAGIVLATFLRDLGWYSRFVKGWPLSNEITNWDRVDELLSSAPPPKP